MITSRLEDLRKRVRRRWDELTKNTEYRIIRYWNGICPFCTEHIGIDIKIIPNVDFIGAECPVCGEQLYELIRESEQEDRS